MSRLYSNLVKSTALAALCAGFVPTAQAAVTPIYAGGGTLAWQLYRNWSDCGGTVMTGDTRVSQCTVAGTYSTYEWAWAAVGSGAGLTAFLGETSPTATPSLSPYQDSAHGIVYPYPSFQFADSDAPLDVPLDSTVASPQTTLAQYNAAGLPAKRGNPIQVPTIITSITVPYNKTNLNGLPAGAGGSNEEKQFNLTKDMVCYIWTQKNAAGNAVTGSYDFSNSYFTTAGANPNVTGGISVPIKPIHRADGSGTTYIFTQYLHDNCAGYTAAGYSAPATKVTWPSFVTVASANGSGGELTSVQATTGGIGYVTPDVDEPVKPNTSPTAYVQNPGTNAFIIPTSAAVIAAEQNVAPPNQPYNVSNWGAKLTSSLFNVKAASAYPIVGPTFLTLYTCYKDTATVTGVKNFTNFYTNSNITEANNMAKALGFAPLNDGLKNSSNETFHQAIYDAVVTGKTPAGTSSGSQPLVVGAVGSSQCSSYDGK